MRRDASARGPSRPKDARPAPRPPEAFEFFIGGYAGTSHRVVWEDGELRWGDRAVVSEGSNAYPGVGATVSGSNTFRAFLRAVRRLTGVDDIG